MYLRTVNSITNAKRLSGYPNDVGDFSYDIGSAEMFFSFAYSKI